MAGTIQGTNARLLDGPHHNPNPFGKSARSSPLLGLESLPTRSVGKEFELLSIIGDGACGRVYKARHINSQILVALKRLHTRDEGFTKEVCFLRQLRDQDGIVKLFDTFVSQEDGMIFLAFEYMELDLSGLLSLHLPLTYDQRRYLFKRVIEATASCHRESVLHRDLKSSNFLVDCSARVKLADFGLATHHNPEDPEEVMSPNVVTLWYRAPELLLGSVKYDAGVDTWSLGCIMVELMTGKSPFPGRDETQQLELIYRVCGNPDLPATDPKHRRRVADYFCQWPREALDLLERFLQLDPAQRISVDEALRHEFFASLTPESEVFAQSGLSVMLANQQVHEYEVKQQRAATARAAQQRAQPTNGQARPIATIVAAPAAVPFGGSRKRLRDEREDSLSPPDRPAKRCRMTEQPPVQTPGNLVAVLSDPAPCRPRVSDHCVRRTTCIDAPVDGVIISSAFLPNSTTPTNSTSHPAPVTA